MELTQDTRSGRLTAGADERPPPRGIAEVLLELWRVIESEHHGEAKVTWGPGDVQIAVTRHRKYIRSK